MIALLAFLCGFALDIVWAKCVSDVQSKRPIHAANMSVLVYLCTAISTMLVVGQCIAACVAYAIGGWVGPTPPSECPCNTTMCPVTSGSGCSATGSDKGPGAAPASLLGTNGLPKEL